jgi:hypothetical protein
MSFLQFFNLQYWYCVIYSLFGGQCTDVDSLSAGNTGDAAINVPAVTPPPSHTGFWGWLFGRGDSGVSTAASVTHTGFFGGILDAVLFVAGIIGALISFLWALYAIIAYIVSGLLVLGILGMLVGLFLIRSEDSLRYGELAPAASTIHPLRGRWSSLLDGAMSADPKKWREGILEADAMLGEMLANLGYTGTDTSDQIRLVPENAFVTLPLAWEAHRIRNFVLAKSSNFILTQQEAFRVMKLYEQVFEEFDFI